MQNYVSLTTLEVCLHQSGSIYEAKKKNHRTENKSYNSIITVENFKTTPSEQTETKGRKSIQTQLNSTDPKIN